MKKYNISKPRKYTDAHGTEKTYWDKVGEMLEFDNGNRIVKIPAIGLEANVFEDKPREEQKPDKPEPEIEDTYPDERVDPADQNLKADDIPF